MIHTHTDGIDTVQRQVFVQSLRALMELTSLLWLRSHPVLLSLSWDLELLPVDLLSTFSPASTRFTALSLDSCIEAVHFHPCRDFQSVLLSYCHFVHCNELIDNQYLLVTNS